MALTLLKLEDIKECISMKEAIDTMEIAFKQLAKQEVIMPMRTPIPIQNQNALTLTMPAYLPNLEALGLKVVSFFPNNAKKNLPSIYGTILLLDAATGAVEAIMEGTYLTALRTGAVSGLATKYLAREDAKHLAVIGSGVQAVTQLEAMATVRDIEKVSIYSRNRERATQFADTISEHFEVKVCKDIKQAVAEADIICTATNSTEPLIYLQDIGSNVHINAIGSHTKEMREIANNVLAKALVIVDQKEAALAEAGEIIHAIANKALTKTRLKELGHMLTKNTTYYKKRLTVFKSVGLAIQDISIAQTVYHNAKLNRLGSKFEL
ncbi:ornithine cyclodeaminase family protein [Legionella jamestowniensis]|uniref:Delta(1)-pyrroline-2-carboxylate reductase n=1 Tax=Legionella jamestowniensis TaxID=455 RepID=A0A0W0UGS4_9GAMM|nr:ornithine cyclodeaminase [Legionella jamestowniensis]KTD07109.1 ornithine cyclodeaminase [Legionella jamestowniensis]OCH98939.1 ornithine cyclodeaminase [Legionella jamestowniensis]SFL71020.1 ornithine cyclodeaminase [Legionella jamestowniensis DSM 19215]